MAQGLGAGNVVKVGKTVELEVLDTPGHTMCHVCLLSHTDRPALFCGDTLFNAANNGIGISPFHGKEGMISAALQAKLTAALNGMKNGSVTTCPAKCGQP